MKKLTLKYDEESVFFHVSSCGFVYGLHRWLTLWISTKNIGYISWFTWSMY